jgi:hypothetical protein
MARQTDKQERQNLEEFLISKQLYILNEESDHTTFRSSRGSSNIDFTLVSNQLLRVVGEWDICDQVSCSDHNIIRFVMVEGKGSMPENYVQDVRYIVQKGNIEKYQANLIRLAGEKICKVNEQKEYEELDKTLSARAHLENDVEKLIDEFYEVLKGACNESFRTQRVTNRATANRSVPWWTKELTTMRKRLNALRRRYQRTRNNEELRQQPKVQYLEARESYALAIKKEKISSLK